MTAIAYRDRVLALEGVALPAIADAVGTPVYCYASAVIEARYRAFTEAFAELAPTICYALKANGNLAVVRTLAALGAGADVVSAGELRRALAAGVPAERIVFSGVGKSAGEIAFALASRIHQINVESEAELALISALAVAAGVVAPVALRVNPDVDAGTHRHITTGRRDNKFGIPFTEAPRVAARAASLPGVDLLGLAVHIGSQLTDLAPFAAAFARLAGLVQSLRAEGQAIARLDLGGGLGIPYEGEAVPSVAAYAAVVREAVGDLGCALAIEPGRALVGEAGVLLTRVLYVKDTGFKRFVIVDAGMNDFLRPALYGSHHAIEPVAEPAAEAPLIPCDVVGPVCETADTFARARPLAPLAADDLLVIRDAGAYGAAMASCYNGRALVPEVLVRGDAFAVVRRRPGPDEAMTLEAPAPWQRDAAERTRGAA